jgi:hypothetical protein
MDPGREHRPAVSTTSSVNSLEPVKGSVEISEEAVVLNVDFVGVHAHDGAFIHYFDIPRHVVSFLERQQK